MVRLIKKLSKKAGLSPGTLVHIGEKKTEVVRIDIIDYDADRVEEKRLDAVDECVQYKDTETVTWINITGIHQVDIIEKIGKQFGMHPLVLEDIVNTDHRPKMEDFDSYIFVIIKMLRFDQAEGIVKAEQVSLILGENFVISFQEREGDVFDPVRSRIRAARAASDE